MNTVASALAGLVVLALLAESASAQGLKADGEDFSLSTFEGGEQGQPEVACTAAQQCVAVWASRGQDGDALGVYVRRFDGDGIPLTLEQPVNTTTAGFQNSPDVCIDAAGGFVVTWAGAGSGDGDGVFARRFDADGAALGDEFLVNTTTTGSQTDPRIACAADGRFVVSWTDRQPVNDLDVFAQRFDASGVAAGAEFQVNPVNGGMNLLGGVSAEADGDFLVVWTYATSSVLGFGGEKIFLRRHDADGTAHATVLLANNPDNPPFEEGDIFAPDVTHDPDGGYVVGWTKLVSECSSGLPDAICNLYGRVALSRFDAGDQFGGGYTSSGGSIDALGGPALAAGSRGFVATYDRREDVFGSPGENIFATPFDLSADPISPETRVNQQLTGTRTSPAIAATGDGRYLIAWTAYDQVSLSDGIYARFFCYDADLDGACDKDDACPDDAEDDNDGDGACGDVDNCLGVANADQLDTDGDDVGDACESCPGHDDGTDGDGDDIPDGCDLCLAEGPDGNLRAKSQIILRGVNNGIDGDDRLSLKGSFVAPIHLIRPDLEGARLRIASFSGTVLLDALLPSGLYAGAGTAGWRQENNGSWSFLDKSSAPVAGVSKIGVKRGANQTNSLKVFGRKGTYPVVPGDEPLGVSLELGDSSGDEGVCTEGRFTATQCEFTKDDTMVICR